MCVYMSNSGSGKFTVTIPDAETVVLEGKALTYRRERVPEIGPGRRGQIEEIADMLVRDNQ
jgi:hypothetical protein